VPKGALVIDVGINRLTDSLGATAKLVGDVDYIQVMKKAAYISPVPGVSAL